ncbi:class I SAM-dependent methyltransferase [Chryseobacterium taiwanense]|uniref:Methyltransferase n=1 Tax=Chryseobacterium taiwanense TaxID=363331 RepID=A0A0B4DCW5_9FLAO|nr:class I SAM-dependent methyltransferase [Chryseobacterium taiwanense]KIC64536.1 hypothetical protein RM51_03055 [Chryseobacterium taiwanense]
MTYKINIENTDKFFWHRYDTIYNDELSHLENVEKIVEFGVFKGDSVRWLNRRYPDAKIYGADILPVQVEWTENDRIEYHQLDQDKISDIQSFFEKTENSIDLIIEDGSHFPQHQKNCLVIGMDYLKAEGIYILEDLHTSHPHHAYYIQQGKTKNYISPLHLLLFIEHSMSNNIEIQNDKIQELTTNSLFNFEEIKNLIDCIKSIKIYRRSTLPKKCYNCNSSDYNYHNLKCKCGADIFAEADSMTAILVKK